MLLKNCLNILTYNIIKRVIYLPEMGLPPIVISLTTEKLISYIISQPRIS
jgi:hypothetical protein